MPRTAAVLQQTPLEAQLDRFFTEYRLVDAEADALLRAYLSSPGSVDAGSCARALARRALAAHSPDEPSLMYDIYNSVIAAAEHLPQRTDAVVALVAGFRAAADEAQQAGSDLAPVLCNEQGGLPWFAAVVGDAWNDHVAWTQHDRGERFARCQHLHTFLARLCARGLVPFVSISMPLSDVFSYAAIPAQAWGADTKTLAACDPETRFMEEFDDPEVEGVNMASVDFAIPMAARWMAEAAPLLWEKARTGYPEHVHAEQDRWYNMYIFQPEGGERERCFCVQSWRAWREGLARIAVCPQVAETTRQAAEEAGRLMQAAEENEQPEAAAQ